MKDKSTIEIDFTNIKTLDEFYGVMIETFGFPDFFGRNIHALIDCLFNLRYPEAKMSNIHVSHNEFLFLILINFSSVSKEIKDTLLIALEEVSYKLETKEQKPSIVLILK